MKKIIGLVFVMLIIFLVGCGSQTKEKLSKLRKLKSNPEYYFVGDAGITKNNESINYVSEILKQVKKDKKTVTRDNGYLDSYIFSNDRIYFIYDYYWSGNEKIDYSKTTNSYCLGYYDLVNFKLIILEYFEEINVQIKIKLISVLSDNIYIKYDNKLKQYNISEKKFVDEYTYSNEVINIAKQTDNSFAIKTNHNVTVYTKNKKYQFSSEMDINFFFIYDEKIVFLKYNNLDMQTTPREGFNLSNNNKLSEEELSNLINDFIEINSLLYEYDSDLYKIDYDEEVVEFIKIGSEEKKTITINNFKEKSEEYKIITQEIFNKECFISKVIVQGDDVFIIVRNDDSFFGYYSGAIPPLIYKYDFTTEDLTYLGYYSFVYYNVYRIYKNA